MSTVADNGLNPYASNPLYADKTLHELCRLGDFPSLFEGSQFPHSAAALEAFQRSWTPYTGQLDDDVSARALAALFDKIGDGILVTHYMGGTVGWRTPFLTDHVKAIVAYEPGGAPFLFPEGEVPAAQPTLYPPVVATAKAVPLDDFMKLTGIPIILFYGDYIYQSQQQVGPDKWSSELDMAQKFVDAINRHGGKAQLVRLPELGIRGNSHFLMSEQNNQQVADLMVQWLADQGF